MKISLNAAFCLLILFALSLSCNQTKMVSCPDYSSDRSLAMKQDKGYRVKNYKHDQSAWKNRLADLVSMGKKNRPVPVEGPGMEELASSDNEKSGSMISPDPVEGYTEVVSAGNITSAITGKANLENYRTIHASGKINSDILPLAIASSQIQRTGKVSDDKSIFIVPVKPGKLVVGPVVSVAKSTRKKGFSPNKSLAIIAFVLALLVFIPFLGGLTFLPAVFFTGFSLFRYRKTGDKAGRGFAIASLILEALVTVFILAFLLSFYFFGEGY